MARSRDYEPFLEHLAHDDTNIARSMGQAQNRRFAALICSILSYMLRSDWEHLNGAQEQKRIQ
ncbi:hypothetical protein WG66_003056 [Moniliophthora roreri]|nr:hypothetical protein WG66_003056 [Moniliophthora roreri]